MKQQYYAIESAKGYWSGCGWSRTVIQWHVGYCETVAKSERLPDKTRVIQKHKRHFWL